MAVQKISSQNPVKRNVIQVRSPNAFKFKSNIFLRYIFSLVNISTRSKMIK